MNWVDWIPKTILKTNKIDKVKCKMGKRTLRKGSRSTPEVVEEIIRGTRRAMAGRWITRAAGIGWVGSRCEISGEHDGDGGIYCPIKGGERG